MKTTKDIQDFLDRYLLTVQKPGRYVGGEYNQVTKRWDSIESKVALVFPDLYDIGLPNLGIAILYELLNKRKDTLAERAYSPWQDMEIAMRSADIPLYSLENKMPLLNFDIVGISVPYETLYTNVLNILDLAHIPVLSSERDEKYPLIIVGGHATYNPEPIANFIDCFVIGEGEEIINEIVDKHQIWKRNCKKSKEELLSLLSEIDGLYIPSFFKPVYKKDGTISGIKSLTSSTNLPIRKRILSELPPPPTKLLVPSINVVHNRVAVEIMRGCTRGCRFCHAGMINRPIRERTIEEVISAIDTALDNTGFEEIALLSLSSSDYSYISELVDEISCRYKNKHLTISLPSLRIESFSIDLLEKLKESRQSSFTLAPEAATDKMRNIINKPISDEQLLKTVEEIYERGWLSIKLYFMIGHPSESLDDVFAIAKLCKEVIKIGKRYHGRKAKLNIGVSTFVPKPHTPFQWVPCDTFDQIYNKQSILRKELKVPGVKLNWSDPRDTFLEATLSRGDRRLGNVIYYAWQNGAKFDAWQDTDNYVYWEDAFNKAGVDPFFYSQRERTIEEIFPWDHINTGVSKKHLLKEYEMSLQGQTRPDCRNKCYACGILSTFADLRANIGDNTWKCP